MEVLLTYSSQIYAGIYFGAIVVLALLEWVFPRREAGDLLGLRWFGNFAITFLDGVIARALFPLIGTGWAAFCAERGWGLFQSVALPSWSAFLLTFTALDLMAYGSHYLFHRIPVLWRVHRMHHTDSDYDFSTGVRFHPLETIVTTSLTLVVIAALGAPPAVVLLAQVITLVANFVEHANIRIPASVDRIVRRIVVTPDMHRVHHSVNGRENRSNFGSVLPWWDRLFGTYVDQPAAGHDAMTFGVTAFSERKHQTLPWMLAQPFLRSGSTVSSRARTADTSRPVTPV